MTPEELVERAEAAIQRKDLETGERYLKQVLALTPDSSALWEWLGRLQASQDRPEEALTSLERALDLEPESGSVNLSYSLLLVDAGRLAEARQALARASAGLGETPDAEQRELLELARLALEIQTTKREHWRRGDDGSVYPTTHAGLAAVDRVLKSAAPKGKQARQLARETEAELAHYRARRFSGSAGVVIASLLFGVLLLQDHKGGGVALGPLYLLSGLLYLHAARAPVYKRLARGGELGAAHFLVGVAEDKDEKFNLLGFLLGFTCLAAFAPVLVLYHYVRNYLVK